MPFPDAGDRGIGKRFPAAEYAGRNRICGSQHSLSIDGEAAGLMDNETWATAGTHGRLTFRRVVTSGSCTFGEMSWTPWAVCRSNTQSRYC
jgi:hypothetical protein